VCVRVVVVFYGGEVVVVFYGGEVVRSESWRVERRDRKAIILSDVAVLGWWKCLCGMGGRWLEWRR